MLWIALALFALAAVGGLGLTFLRAQGSANPPLPLALVHGAAAATALVLLLGSVFTGAAVGGLVNAAVGLFVLAALGGFGLFGVHMMGKPIPLAGVAVHALVAVIAFLMLAVVTLG